MDLGALGIGFSIGLIVGLLIYHARTSTIRAATEALIAQNDALINENRALRQGPEFAKVARQIAQFTTQIDLLREREMNLAGQLIEAHQEIARLRQFEDKHRPVVMSAEKARLRAL